MEKFSPEKKTFFPAIKPGKTEKVQQPAFEDQDTEPLSTRKGAVFKYTKNELCEARYLRYENLQRHMMADACMRYTKKRTESMFDLVTRTYIGEFGGASLAAARERGDESDSVLRFVDLPSASLNEKFEKFLVDYQPLSESLQPGFALTRKRGCFCIKELQQ